MQNNSALIVVDVQNGFTPGGNLAVANADQIIPKINQLAQYFDNVVLTQDWHPENHISFAENHAGRKPAVLYQRACAPHAQLVIRKGFHAEIDSYSAFMEADHKTSTGLAGYLNARGIDTLFIAGIATDFCVAWTAIDACRLGFKTFVVSDASKGIDLQGSLQHAWQDMLAQGVKRIYVKDIASLHEAA